MSVQEPRKETRRQMLFERWKKIAEIREEPFPYNNWEEWKADEPKREAERKRYWSQKHVWLEDFFFNDRANYNFINPETDQEVSVDIHHGANDTCLEIGLTVNDNGVELAPFLNGPYIFDELSIAKIDIINVLRKWFPKVTGWNDDFKNNPTEIRHIPLDDLLFPQELNSILRCFDYHSVPQLLYTLGDARLLRKPVLGQQRIAIIGSRKPDKKGMEAAYRLGKFFSEDIVVSGLARGVDAAAHQGCLDTGGKTIAVVGSGLNHVHPKENIDLQQRIIDTGGLILSEQEPKLRADPRRLIARTRIQMALADKVYVVECEKESGTMHAVNSALKYHKPIYALDCDWSGNRYLLDNGLAKPLNLNI